MRRDPYHPGSLRRELRGFTLIEAVMAIVLVGVLAMAVIPVISSGVKTYAATTTSLNTLTKLRFATERMARELREVRRVPLMPGNYDFVTMGGNAVSFYKTDGNQVTITGGVPNATLAYATPPASATLTDQMNAATDLAFTYYDASGVITASPAQVAFVDISLTLTEDGAPVSQRTRVALRNLQ